MFRGRQLRFCHIHPRQAAASIHKAVPVRMSLDSDRINTLTCCRPHIRNVICIALYPPPSKEDDRLESRMDAIPSSPSKYTPKHQRTSRAPTATASEAARQLLAAYARTNTPGSLLRALPGYGLSGLQGLDNMLHDNNPVDDDSDSEISRYSRHVREAKNCWDILREGYLRLENHRGSIAINGASSSRHSQQDAMSDREESPTEIPSPVGQHAWPMLEWLLMVFEKDEARVMASGQREPHSTLEPDNPHQACCLARFSPLLLSQIPSSRSASNARWDIEAPLDIVFYCLEQHDRSSLGARLLALVRRIFPF